MELLELLVLICSSDEFVVLLKHFLELDRIFDLLVLH